MNADNNIGSIDLHRRLLLGVSTLLPSLIMMNKRSQASMPSRHSNKSGQLANMPFDPLKQINAGELNIGYADMGPSDGEPIILLHGWPYDIHTYAEVAPMLSKKGFRVVVPYLRGFGTTHFLSPNTKRNAQQSALAVDTIALMDALEIKRAIIGGCDWGARTANVVAALWPERCKGIVSVSGYLIGSQALGAAPLAPMAELQWWYQYYFATERGRAGYQKHTREFAKLIWQLASPQWEFDDATFQRTARSFDNPDHVPVVVHNYRWRLGLAEGDHRLDEIERRLEIMPAIQVPAITLEGDANGAPHPAADSYAAKFKDHYEHRVVEGGIGHNLPQESPALFAQALIDLAALRF